MRHGRIRGRGAGDLARAATTVAPACSGLERTGGSWWGRSGYEPGMKVTLAAGLAGQARAGQVPAESGCRCFLSTRCVGDCPAAGAGVWGLAPIIIILERGGGRG